MLEGPEDEEYNDEKIGDKDTLPAASSTPSSIGTDTDKNQLVEQKNTTPTFPQKQDTHSTSTSSPPSRVDKNGEDHGTLTVPNTISQSVSVTSKGIDKEVSDEETYDEEYNDEEINDKDTLLATSSTPSSTSTVTNKNDEDTQNECSIQ